MSFQTKELSPVHFLPDGELSIRNEQNCANTSDYCQPVKRDSRAVFQVDLSAVDGTGLVNDGAFAALCGVNWTCGGSVIINPPNADFVGVSTLTQTIGTPIKQFSLYQLKFDITSSSSTIALNANLSTVGALGIDASNSPKVGVKTTFTGMVFMSIVPPSDDLVFTGIAGTFSMTNVSLIEFSAISFEVRDIINDTVVFTEVDGASVTYHPTFPTAKVDFAWSNIPDNGKYEICLFGGDEHLTNPDFEDASGWTVSGGSKWTLGGGSASYDAGGFPSTVSDREMIQPVTVPKGVCFQFKVIMVNFLSGNTSVQFNGAFLTGSPIGADGTTFFSIDNREGEFDLTGDIRFLGSDTTGEFKLDFAGVSTKICSECFCLDDDFKWAFEFEWDNFNGSTNRNAYGFDYEVLNMVHFMLIQGRLGGESYTNVKQSSYVDATGKRVISKNRFQANDIFFTEGKIPVPAYIHAAFANAFAHNRVLVNGVQYVSEVEGLNPLWGDDDLVANFQHQIFRQGQGFTLNC